MKKPLVLDIFCGAGGMSEGFIQAGFNVKYATDINSIAKLTYMNRHKQLGYETKFACMDIKDFSKKGFLKNFLGNDEIDVICGGPPCQGFSLAGKRDKNDPRNMLFKSYMKVINNVKPKYFVMENVEGILSMKFDEYVGIKKNIYENETVGKILINEFWQIGYYVEYKILNACNYGVPQNRKRVFFLGHRIRKYRGGKYKDIVKNPNFPKTNMDIKITVKEAISDLPVLNNGGKSIMYNSDKNLLTKYQIESINGRTLDKTGKAISAKVIHNHEAAKHSDRIIKRFSLINQGEDLLKLRKKLSEDEWEKYKTKKTRCKRIDENKPAPTILTLPDDLIHYNQDRIMSVRELARLQSFDDSFEFLGGRTTGGNRRKKDLPQYTQVGNAVPPLLAKAVALEIRKALENSI